MAILTTQQAFEYLDRMQQSVMAKDSIISLDEFKAESIDEQKRYYNWMLQQGDFFLIPLWTECDHVFKSIDSTHSQCRKCGEIN